MVKHHEGALVQRCLTALSDAEAREHVRAVLADIQRATRADARSPLSLRGFVGTQTLRQWLIRAVRNELKRHGSAVAVNEDVKWVWNKPRAVRPSIRSSEEAEAARPAPGR
jgi:hypothetical protein